MVQREGLVPVCRSRSLRQRNSVWCRAASFYHNVPAFSSFVVRGCARVRFVDSTKFEGLLPGIMTKLSLFDRFSTFVNGVFDLTAVVYYASVIVFFLFLSVQSLEKRRYN